MASEDWEFKGIQGSYVSAGRADELCPDTNDFPCDRHSGVAAVKFCNDHEIAICSECANLLHRACKEVDNLEELAKRDAKGKIFKQFLSDLDNVTQKISKLKRAKVEELGKLRVETNDALNGLSEFRKEINWFLDKLERKGKSYIEKRYNEIHSDINSEVELCDNTLACLEKLKRRLGKLEDKTKRLINMKLGKSKLTTAQTLCNATKETRPRSDFVKMTVDPMVKRFVMHLHWYGKHRTYLSMEAPPSLPHMYAVKQHTHYDARCKGDKSVCNIVGACQMKDGTILLIDSANQKIKQLDVTYKIVDHCEFPGTPVAVCATSSGGAGVLVGNETGSNVYSLQSTPAKLTLSESFQIPEKCTGLDFYDGIYFVSTQNAISTYSASGDIVGAIHENTSGDFGHLRINGDGTKLFVTDATRGLVTMDADGANVELFSDPALKGTTGVCCDRCNQVFICGFASHNVIQLGHNGARLGELLDQRKDIKCPLSLCYDGMSKRLVVTRKNTNVIKVYQLK